MVILRKTYTVIANIKSISIISFLAILSFLSPAANAALVSSDWKTAGDGALTYDDNSGLWWLDLTVTAGMSYSQVSAQLAAGGTLEGWRYATTAEANDIYAQFGLYAGAENLPIDDFKSAIATMNSYFGDLLGASSHADTHSGSWSISGTEWPGYPDWHLMYVAYNYYNEDTGEHAVLDLGVNYSADLDMTWEYAGSLLVRDNEPVSPVPLPAAIALFPAGMFLFGWAGRRRRI